MREQFRGDLYAFDAEAKKRQDADTERNQELDDLEPDFDWRLSDIARREGTTVETQEQIFVLQTAKRESMDRLRERLRCLDDEGCKQEAAPESRKTEYADGTYRYVDSKGKGRAASFGDIITDLSWGITYDLDKSQVPRAEMKRYEVARAKQEMGALLDEQIIKSQGGSRKVNPGVREVYDIVAAERESGEAERRTGFIAERMVKGLLKKAVIDADMPFEVHDADVFQDVEESIDFIIRTKRSRGVRVDAKDHGTKDVGIQFTINPEARQRKTEQLERKKQRLRNDSPVDDLMLVVLPMDFVQRLHKAWEQDGKPAGGPDKLLRRENAKDVFFQVLGGEPGVLTRKEIEKEWKKIEGRYAQGRND